MTLHLFNFVTYDLTALLRVIFYQFTSFRFVYINCKTYSNIENKNLPRNLIDVLGLDDGLQIVLEDLREVVLQFRAAEILQNRLPVGRDLEMLGFKIVLNNFCDFNFFAKNQLNQVLDLARFLILHATKRRIIRA